MARRVEWTETAADDLDAVAQFIARDSFRYASASVREVRDAASSLAEMAERGRTVPEFGDASIGELIVRSYRLIYHVSEEVVSIIGFIHGARDLLALWQREGRASPQNSG